MNGASDWLLHVSVGGSGLLLVAWLIVRGIRQPARRLRVAELGAAGAVLLAGLCAVVPAWIEIPVINHERAATTESTAAANQPPPAVGNEAPAIPIGIHLDVVAPPAEVPDRRVVEPVVLAPVKEPVVESAQEAPATTEFRWEHATQAIVLAYAAGVLFFLSRLAWGHWQLARFLKGARPVSRHAHHVFDELSPGLPRARLLVSDSVPVPFSCGVLRPVIVLPAGLCQPEAREELRWVLAHEIAHLQRRDALTGMLFGVAQALFFFVPWFWWLRREVRLCQELVADHAAVADGAVPEDYAEFLLSWTTASAVPLGAAGVFDSSSDLYRRVSMLVNDTLKVEPRCPRRWSLVAGAGLLALAIVGAGVGLKAVAADDPPKVDKKDPAKPDKKDAVKEDKKDPAKEDKKDEFDPFKLPGAPDLDDLLKRFGGNVDPEQMKMIQRQLDQVREMMRQVQKQMQQGRGAFPGFPQVPQNPGAFPNFPQLPDIPNLPGNLRRLDALRGSPAASRLGVRLDKPTAAMVDQLDLPRDQGLVIEEVLNDSAAAKAGLKAHDILLELDGKAVPSDVREFVKQLQDIKADTKVDAVVLRKSRKETVKNVTLPKAEARPGRPGNLFPNLPQLPGQPFPAFPGKNALQGSTSVQRTNDDFTASNQQGDTTVSISGKIVGNKAEVAEITVKEGEKATKYEKTDKVPEAHRGTVQELIRMSEGNGGNFQFQFPAPVRDL